MILIVIVMIHEVESLHFDAGYQVGCSHRCNCQVLILHIDLTEKQLKSRKRKSKLQIKKIKSV